MKVMRYDGIPVKIWASDLEEAALEQVKNLSRLPFAFHHVALMPDAHCGFGMPIGGVLATKGVVIPNAVGVDIGCGVITAKLNLKTSDINREQLVSIVEDIKDSVPVGFSKHSSGVNSLRNLPSDMMNGGLNVISRNLDNAINSMGTLGGGNHFIEIQKSVNDDIWVMIHTGSRNLGKQVAEYYNKVAIEKNKLWYSSVPEDYELAFLPYGDSDYYDYMNEMNACVKFAEYNRRYILKNVVQSFRHILADEKVLEVFSHSIHHNYVTMENHFGENVLIHRKGATSAKKGELGIIPGSQGTSSYIVSGLGNPESFNSCSHGAGRLMSRKRAKKELDLQMEMNILNSQGILHNMINVDSLDEAPSAYKDIDVVMENQKDLVNIVEKLIPIAVIKG
ncbi:RtcB family protein [Candidatus Dojkabacteria bacterium]|jgi:tRNA-splicing ligase RtcB|nr:RtcB family protein [Candidatus Dojkabacteria bacterium]